MGSKIAEAEGVEMSFKPLQKVGAIIGALKSGQIDAWSIVPHIAKPLAGSGAVHIIGDVSDYLPRVPGHDGVHLGHKCRGGAPSGRRVSSRPIRRAWRDYNAAMIDEAGGEEGVAEMVDLIHKYVYTDRPREEAAPSIINGTMRLNEGAALNVASVRDQLEWFQSEGLVDDEHHDGDAGRHRAMSRTSKPETLSGRGPSPARLVPPQSPGDRHGHSP